MHLIEVAPGSTGERGQQLRVIDGLDEVAFESRGVASRPVPRLPIARQAMRRMRDLPALA